jgi:hypothetical protein
MALLLVELLQVAFRLQASDIRCTSVSGYGLPIGVSIESVLRGDVSSAQVFIGLLSRNSLQSLYVLFELGARWGGGKPILPILLPGLSYSELRGPLANVNAVKISNVASGYQLVNEVGRILKLTPESSDTILRYLERLAGILGTDQ